MSILTDADVALLIARLGGSSIVTTADQTLITGDVVPNAERMVKEHLGYEVEEDTYTEYLPGMDGRTSESSLESSYLEAYGSRNLATSPVSELFVGQYPLRSVTSVYENQDAWETNGTVGDWSSGFLLTLGSDYTIDWDEPGISFSGSLKRFGAWSPIRRSIKVTYVAGYTADELASSRWRAIKDAVMLTAQKFYLDVTTLRRTESGPGGFGFITSEKLDDLQATYSTAGLTSLFGFSSTLPPQAMRLLEKHVWMKKLMSR